MRPSRNVRQSEMAHKNGATGDAIFDTPVIVGNQPYGLPVSANALAGRIDFQLPNTAVTHG